MKDPTAQILAERPEKLTAEQVAHYRSIAGGMWGYGWELGRPLSIDLGAIRYGLWDGEYLRVDLLA